MNLELTGVGFVDSVGDSFSFGFSVTSAVAVPVATTAGAVGSFSG